MASPASKTQEECSRLVRNILLALLSSLAKVEAQKISDRTRAGMARAKARALGLSS
jgi:DNA invertase Pin-like site-specific DNA recombinase